MGFGGHQYGCRRNQGGQVISEATKREGVLMLRIPINSIACTLFYKSG
jgi:hypothetical protein